MTYLVEVGGIAVIEHPPTENKPEYEISKDGSLFVYGYKSSPFPFMKPIASMKKFDFQSADLNEYEILGQYEEAKSKTEKDLFKMVRTHNININNAVFLRRLNDPQGEGR